MPFMNPRKAGGWAWVGVIGGILVFVGVFLPWLDLWGLATATGFQIGIMALSSGDGFIAFIVGNTIFIWLFGIAGLALLFATKFKLAMVFGILAQAFIILDIVMYILADFGSLLSIGPFVMLAGAVMLGEGARKLSKGAAPNASQVVMETAAAPYGYGQYAYAPPGGIPDYSHQNLYGSDGASGQAAYDPNSQYAQTNQNWPPKQP